MFGCECPITDNCIINKTAVVSNHHGVLDNRIRGGNVIQIAYYPKAGLISIGTHLLSVLHVGWGKHFWENIAKTPHGIKIQLSSVDDANLTRLRLNYYITMNFTMIGDGGNLVPCTWSCPASPLRWSVHISVYLRRISRAIKRFLQRKYADKMLALTMGLHVRLGAESLLRCLHGDTLAEIGRLGTLGY
jgi:hypothetical protein